MSLNTRTRSHRDIDGYVGCMIMGLPNVTWKNHLKETGLVYKGFGSDKKGQTWACVPFYTLYINSAWQVVEKLKPGYSIEINHEKCAFIDRKTNKIHQHEGYLPYAISMAALSTAGFFEKDVIHE